MIKAGLRQAEFQEHHCFDLMGQGYDSWNSNVNLLMKTFLGTLSNFISTLSSPACVEVSHLLSSYHSLTLYTFYLLTLFATRLSYDIDFCRFYSPLCGQHQERCLAHGRFRAMCIVWVDEFARTCTWPDSSYWSLVSSKSEREGSCLRGAYFLAEETKINKQIRIPVDGICRGKCNREAIK